MAKNLHGPCLHVNSHSRRPILAPSFTSFTAATLRSLEPNHNNRSRSTWFKSAFLRGNRHYNQLQRPLKRGNPTAVKRASQFVRVRERTCSSINSLPTALRSRCEPYVEISHDKRHRSRGTIRLQMLHSFHCRTPKRDLSCFNSIPNFVGRKYVRADLRPNVLILPRVTLIIVLRFKDTFTCRSSSNKCSTAG